MVGQDQEGRRFADLASQSNLRMLAVAGLMHRVLVLGLMGGIARGEASKPWIEAVMGDWR